MAMEAVVRIRMDANLKKQVEELYKSLGTSFAEAVRMFAQQSVSDKAMPFILHEPIGGGKTRPFGIAKGKFFVSDDFDEDDGEMEKLFEGEA